MHSQHNSSLLHETENGSIIKCSCCQNLQVIFGNMVLRLEYEQFLTFMECIDQIDLDKPNHSSLPNDKTFMVKLPNNIAFAFSRDEMAELKELLEWSQASMKVNDLLESEF